MRIKKVQLKNYRSHSEIEVEFSRGINLILGRNGRGKSSILEAIGLALFHIKDRTGKSTGKTFLKYGEKECSILVEFLANDGREYSIFHQYFEKKGKIMILKDLSTELEYRDGIEEKLEDLCGIKSEYRDVYENVIVAKQNEFINIFKETPENRAKIFNKIFHTEIYANLFSNLKGLSEQYQKEKEELETAERVLSATLGNRKESFAACREEEKAFILWTRRKEEELQKKRKLTKEVEEWEKIEKEYEVINSSLSLQKTQIEQNKKEFLQHLSEAKRAKKARCLLEEHQSSYDEYTNLEKQIQEKKKEQEVLQKIREENRRLKVENEKLELLREKNRKEEEILQGEHSEYGIQLLSLQKKIRENRKSKEEITLILSDLQQSRKEMEASKEKQKEWEKESVLLQKQVFLEEKHWKEKTERISNLDIESIQSSLEQIQAAKIKLQGKREKLVVYQQNIEDYQTAMETLKQKVCPFLKETCENVKNLEVESYFREEMNKTKIEMEKLSKEIATLQKELEQEQSYRKQEVSYKLLKEEADSLEKTFLYHRGLWKEVQLHLEREQRHLERLLLVHKFSNLEEIQQKIRALEDSLLVLKVEEKEKEAEEFNKKIFTLENRIQNLEKEKTYFIEKRKENESKIQEEKEECWKKISGEIETLEEKRKHLQASYQIYLENKKLAIPLEERKEKIYALYLERKERRKVQKSLEKQKEHLETRLRKNNKTACKENLAEVEKFLLQINERLGEIGQKIKHHKQELERLNVQEEKIKELAGKRNKIEKKWKKAENIRKNIKEMGTEVSKNMLAHISEGATINFHKITGRSEKICWSNEDNDKYQVYLSGANQKIEYHLLSGGEQVSVAIAIRGSMAQYFSNSRFMILDEPTNNLDLEKRKLLAEYMGEILHHLEQSIIVTHDDTFREMAEKIIEL
ncbi:SMC family ATPase [Fusobacterium necrophorum]|uniref:AAA family ATPase n=1 Tax=Fusobacterium necrophorum TaxID=859 RepID=UPI00254A7563|nr:SMC family ATPase [Fusobacterium necrophorum]MDK4521748.1 SMC family ATPase [Fusobacterium necrophorum]